MHPLCRFYSLVESCTEGKIFCMTQKSQNFHESGLCERFAHFGRPCRGLSPGKGFAPKRISHMTRRAFLALRVIQAQGNRVQTCLSKMGKIDHKNEDISESVNSIDRGAIFPPRSGHDLSRNASVVSVYAL